MHDMFSITLLLIAQLLGSALALRYHNTIHNHALRSRTIAVEYDGTNVPQYNISVPVDHFNSSNEQTYINRYWMNDTYYQPGGPIFFYDAGESGVTDQQVAESLAEVNRTTSVMRLAEKYSGTAIMWEHRYFGLSLPVPLNESTNEPEGGFDGYEFLTLEQAFEDVVYFAQNFCPDNYAADDCEMLRPSSTPWIWIGGSYPGIRGAIMRIRNPEVFYAVWASSAPLEAMYDGSFYFNPIEASMPSNCSTDVRAIIKYADEVMSGDHGEETYSDLQRLTVVTEELETYTDLSNASYDPSYADTFTPEDIGQGMSLAIYSAFQSYGPPTTIDLFCDYLESYNPDGIPGNSSDPDIAILTNPADGTVSDEGLVATYNVSVGLSAYFYAMRRMYAEVVNVELNDTNFELPHDFFADQSAWTYLVYTALGWFQGSNPDNVTIISKYYNLSAVFEKRATYSFSNIVAEDFGGPPNSTLLNMYGGWNAMPSNVMFTTGEFDPWRGGTLLSDETYIGAPQRNITQDVPMCNSPPNGTDVFGIVLPGAAHVEDLSTDQETGLSYDGTKSMRISLPLFEMALDVWLPCFNATKS